MIASSRQTLGSLHLGIVRALLAGDSYSEPSVRTSAALAAGACIGCGGESNKGSYTNSVVPPGDVSCTFTSPLWSTTILWTTVSPSPVPFSLP